MQYNVYVTEIPDSSIAFSQRGISGKQKRYFHIIVLSHSLTHVLKKRKEKKYPLLIQMEIRDLVLVILSLHSSSFINSKADCVVSCKVKLIKTTSFLCASTTASQSRETYLGDAEVTFSSISGSRTKIKCDLMEFKFN